MYARVLIRDVDTLSPLDMGRPGLVNLLTPGIQSMPLLSVMTDDLSVLHGEGCPCGNKAPWLEILGRVGVKDVVTCVQGGGRAAQRGEIMILYRGNLYENGEQGRLRMT